MINLGQRDEPSIAYSEAITHVVSTSRPKCLDEGAKDLDNNQAYLDLLSALRFLYRKQQTHAGLDVHHTCLRILEEAISNSDFDDKGLKSAAQTLFYPFQTLEQEPDRFSMVVGDKALDDFLGAWQAVEHIVQKQIDLSREKIRENFLEYINDLTREESIERKNLVIVTHGYSKTVREVLRRYIKSCASLRSEECPKIFVLANNEEDANDANILVMEIVERLPPLTTVSGFKTSLEIS